MDNRQMWMEQILRLLELATEEQLRVLYTAALYIVRGRRQYPKRLGFWQQERGDREVSSLLFTADRASYGRLW